MDDRDIGAEAREVAREIGSDPGDVQTVVALLELGVRPDAMRRALERGRLEDAIFDAALDPERAARTVTPAQIEERGGLPADEIALLMQTAGLPAPGPDDPSFTEDETRLFIEAARVREVWPPELGLQVSRVAGRALARIAQAQVQLFRLHVEPRLRADSGDRVAALPDVHWAFERLLPLATPYLTALHRRLFERELTEVAVREAEARAGGELLPGASEVAILFCDLKDFTAYADREGDEAAIEVIESLASIVTEECHDGRVVKGLGDGYMLAFAEVGDAVDTGWRVVERRRDAEGPGVHASLEHGVAVARDGDYFGRTVNVAARILAAAGRDELIATAAVAQATESTFDWADAGARRVRGVSEPLGLCRLIGPAEPHRVVPQ
ncbi:MAG: adenylate/guanylate cyclase domain-containing protein [Actinomycetota bacterium]|nr:adenylate/guanylate cyclase domain-containing protein [Actinomycetota bacterium]